MRLLAFLRSIASAFFHRSRIEGEMDEELRSHIQSRADDLERSGVSRTEAKMSKDGRRITTHIYVDVTDQRKADGIAALERARHPLAA